MVIWVSSHDYGNNIQKAGRQCCAHQEVKFRPDPGNHCLNFQGNDTVVPENWIIPQRLPKPNPLNSLWFTVLHNLPRTDFISTSDSLLLWNIFHRPYYRSYLKLTMHLKTHAKRLPFWPWEAAGPGFSLFTVHFLMQRKASPVEKTSQSIVWRQLVYFRREMDTLGKVFSLWCRIHYLFFGIKMGVNFK